MSPKFEFVSTCVRMSSQVTRQILLWTEFINSSQWPAQPWISQTWKLNLGKAFWGTKPWEPSQDFHFTVHSRGSSLFLQFCNFTLFTLACIFKAHVMLKSICVSDSFLSHTSFIHFSLIGEHKSFLTVRK